MHSLLQQFFELEKVPGNVWVGATIESQKYINRAERVASIHPTRVRFISCEPLLGKIDLSGILGENKINWVIAGAESGHGARTMDLSWVRSLRDQCAAAKIPFFFKQKIEEGKKVSMPLLDEKIHDGMPIYEGVFNPWKGIKV